MRATQKVQRHETGATKPDMVGASIGPQVVAFFGFFRQEQGRNGEEGEAYHHEYCHCSTS